MKRVATASTWRNTRLKCGCGGYWFPHRRGGGACDHSPRRDYYLAIRAGVDSHDAEALLPSWVLERMADSVQNPQQPEHEPVFP